MLSQNPTSLQQRQRQHRRQQSTPSVYDPSKVHTLPNTTQAQTSHRRGTSLDQRQRRQSPPQGYVSITNQGYRQHQQQILQETQQQRISRGQQPQPFLSYDSDENFIVSPLVSPQRQEFDPRCQMYVSQEPPSPYSYSGPISSIIKVDSNVYNQFGANDLPLYHDAAHTPSAFLDFPSGLEDMSGQHDWNATLRPNSRSPSRRRVSGGMARRIAQFEGMAGQQPASRPITPPTKNAQDYFPLTPATTPFHRQKSQPMPQRFQDGYDNSMEETIKPGRGGQRLQTVFQEMREHAEANRPPSPPSTGTMPSRAKFDSVKMPTSSKISQQSQFTSQAYQSSYYSPEMSQQSTPELSHSEVVMHSNEGASHALPVYNALELYQQQLSPSQSSQMRRSESVDSLLLEETITDTGITIDDIAIYIEGPDANQKWLCKFPECGKKFGRKENIKSHVQTHLGDRQYQCPHCKKCFVRQHDLKRHAKIHSGVKPYPCLCGNSFARHDALTRHRQRGMCIGAFEGVVKKVVKRGRPRKNRPDDDERLDKAARTRSKNKGTASQTSSASEYSESSYGQSPEQDLDVLDDQPFSDYIAQSAYSHSQMPTSTMQQHHVPSPHLPTHYVSSVNSPLASSTASDFVSPSAIQTASTPPSFSSHSTTHHQSRMHYRNNSTISLDLEASHLPALPASRNSPGPAIPELSLSSSSPRAPKFDDFISGLDGGLAHLQMSQMSHTSSSSSSGAGCVGEAINADDSLFLASFGQDADLMGGLKFEDAFAAQGLGLGMMAGEMGMGMEMGMFGGEEDVFFGSP